MRNDALVGTTPAVADTGVLAQALVQNDAPAEGETLPAWWPMFVTALSTRVGTEGFDTWLRDLRFGAQQGMKVLLVVPTVFSADLIRREYTAMIETVLTEVAGAGLRVTVRAAGEQGATAPARDVAAEKKPDDKADKPAGRWLESSQLEARYTFTNFVVGPNSQFAYAAAQRVAEEIVAGKPGGQNAALSFNPFFVHGGVGLGKTHLMQAVGHAVLEKSPQKQVLYLTAEQFLYKFIRAMRDKTMIGFKDMFRGVDMLLIDDVQFIAGKEATQEEFFHTFNTLVSLGKQIILTADRSPHELPDLEERLKSRLGSGLTVEVHAPAVETRLAILTRKAEERGLPLPTEVASFMAESIASNVRELEGALNRLVAFSQLTGNVLTVPFAREQLRDLLRVQTKVVGVDDIQQLTATHFNVRLADMLGPRRTKELVLARQMAQYLCKQLTTKSYPDIGRAFGGRDHTTVIHAVRTIENLLPRDPSLSEAVAILTRQLKGA